MAALAGCNDTAVVLRIASNLGAAGTPGGLTSMCVELDADAAFRFGRRYDLGQLALPQTLTALSGGRASFQALVYGYRQAQEVVRARRQIPFRSREIVRFDVPLDACAPSAQAASGNFSPAGHADGAYDGGRALLTPAPAGDLAVAVSAGGAARLTASSAGLQPLAGGAPSPSGVVRQLLGADLDGDCLQDLVVLAEGGPPAVWRHVANGSFTPLDGAIPLTTPLRAAAIGDADGDGNADLVVAGGAEVRLLLGEGAGRFRDAGAAFDVPPTDATAVALGDLDGNGHLDVVIGQGSLEPALSRIYLNDAKGTGHFSLSVASLPPRPARATAAVLTDIDGDGDLDLLLAHADAPVRLYVNRGDAFFEDRSFTDLPDQVVAPVETLTVADINGDCLPDVIVPRAGVAPLLWLSSGSGKLIAGPPLQVAAATGAAADDVDGDGKPDLLLFGPSGLDLLVQK